MTAPIVLVQISDTHALAAPDRLFLGKNHAENLRATLDLLAARGVDPDAYLLTGDLANNGEAESYWTLKPVVETLRATGKAVALVVGNHDDRTHLRAILDGHATVDPNEPYAYWFDVRGLRVVVLDTSIPGDHEGHVGADQLAWLRQLLATPAPQGTLLVMHHPPVRFGGHAPFVADADALEAVVRGSDVIAVIAGHVHQVMAQGFGGAPLVTAHSNVMLIDPLRRPGIAFVAGGGFSLITVQDRRVLIQPFLLPVLPEVIYHHNPAVAPVHEDMKVFTNS